jgi:hypothetical protein
MEKLFREAPSGEFMIPTLQEALSRIEVLERRLDRLEQKIPDP